MAPYLTSALGSIRLIVRDFQTLLEFVHPVDANAAVYSHRTFELLLRSCTEFEALAKGGAVERNLIAPSQQPNINDLSPLYDALEIATTEVGMTMWHPETLFLRPLDGWKEQPHGLHWYRSYNSVKHNRSGRFSEATLHNVTLSIASCFLLLQRLGGYQLQLERHVHHENNLVEWHFPDVPITIRAPDNWGPATSFG